MPIYNVGVMRHKEADSEVSCRGASYSLQAVPSFSAPWDSSKIRREPRGERGPGRGQAGVGEALVCNE